MLTKRLETIECGQKVFVQPEEKTHHAINRVEKYLNHHRDRFETQEGRGRRSCPDRYNKLTFHGLRYNYVQDRVSKEMAKNRSFRDAAKIVTKEVGHNRIEVIHVYLGVK